jgi:predicted phage replisome organizer
MLLGKKYFWLKLKDDFFNQKEIKMLRRVAGGDTYTIIYLKMLLLSLKNDGKIYYDGIAENMIEETALEIDEDIENVQITFTYLLKKGLIETAHEDEIEMTNIASMIGSETDAAVRKRRQRLKEKRDIVTERSHLGHIEIEIEKDIELEKELQLQQEEKITPVVIVDDVNQAIDFYQQNFGVLNPYTTQQILDAVNTFNEEVVVKAMQIAIESNNRNYSYVRGILKNWYQNNVKTLEDTQALDAEHQNKKTKKSFKNTQKEAVAPAWLNSDKRADQTKETSGELTAEEIEAIEELKKMVVGEASDS